MIPLTQGQYARVDEENYEELNQFNWSARWSLETQTFYALRNVRREDHKFHTELMHRYIIRAQWARIDHINHDTLDNRKSNLRDGTLHNIKNMRHRVGTSSQYKGVDWNKASQKWRARIDIGKYSKSLGYFDDEIDAALAYDEASLLYHGEYGLRNFS